MKKQINILVVTLPLFFSGCQFANKDAKTNNFEGEPVIFKKEYSMIPGICTFTYEGYGRKETFEDKCDKYSVGDKLGGNMEPKIKDSINLENK